jgi:hypothetical protein
MTAIGDMIKHGGYKVPLSMVHYLELHHFSVEDAEVAVKQFQQIGYWEKDGSAWGETSPVPKSQSASGSKDQPTVATPAPDALPTKGVPAPPVADSDIKPVPPAIPVTIEVEVAHNERVC